MGAVTLTANTAVIPGMNAIAFTREVLASSASLEG
jgi:hypothetical protein